MEQQHKTERTARHAAVAPSGEPVTIDEFTAFVRVRYVSGEWSEWAPGTRRLMWGRIPVNLREDGDWETAEAAPRRLTRQS